VDRDRRNELLRTVLGGAGGALVAGVLTGSAIAALAGVVVGILVAFGVERVVDDRAELRVLRERVRECEAASDERERERKLWEHRIAVANRESALHAAMLKVWGDAYVEGTRTGHYPPLDALMARLELIQRTQGMDKPIPPPDV
jgi:hypothetical protein